MQKADKLDDSKAQKLESPEDFFNKAEKNSTDPKTFEKELLGKNNEKSKEGEDEEGSEVEEEEKDGSEGEEESSETENAEGDEEKVEEENGE